MELRTGEIVDEIVALARAEGERLVRRQAAAEPVRYRDRRDFSTAVDLEVERRLKAALRERFPGHGLCGEETGEEPGEGEYRWLIDPVDGTKYYAGGASLYAVSIALLYRDEPILGVVASAATGECFYAWKGGGVWVDGRLLPGPAATAAADAILNVDTPATDRLSGDERRWFEERLLRLTRGVYRIRALGQSSLAAAWIAGGALDAHVDLTGYATPEDVAAARVLLQEAGLRVGHLDPGVGPPRLLAARPELYDELERLLA